MTGIQRKLTVCLTFSLCLTVYIANGQEDDIEGDPGGGSSGNGIPYSDPTADISVILPSPNALSFNKFIDLPVSLYTGTPEISIPLYTIALNQISVPISLNYHASGLKVEEISSFVGAGWSLTASGGVINRTVLGSPDDLNLTSKGLFFTAQDVVNSDGTLDYTSLTNECVEPGSPIVRTVPLNDRDRVAEGRIDTQPDIYYYSFPGGGGKFGFMPDRRLVHLSTDNVKFIKHPYENFDITQPVDVNDYEWILEDAEGVRYTYNTVEKTHSRSISDNDLAAYRDQNFQSAWYLTEISVNGEWIRFYYAPETQEYDVRYSTSQKVRLENGTSSTPGASVTTSTSRQEITMHAKRLLRIESSKGITVYFDSNTERQDLSGSKRLDEIRVEMNGGIALRYRLNYEYFGDNEKLKLTSVQQISNSSTQIAINEHKFEYYAYGSFPSRESKSIDHWGFYNGANNSSLFTVYRDDDWVLGPASALADRNPSLEYCKVGSIKRITYPTGGYTEFDYELHDYRAVGYRTTLSQSVSASGGSASLPIIALSPVFSVSQNCSADLFLIHSNSNDTYQGMIPGSPSNSFTDIDGGEVQYEILRNNNGVWEPASLQDTPGNRKILPAGEYYLKLTNYNSSNVTVVLNYDQKVNTNVDVGGLRIKKLTFYDADTEKELIKAYQYNVDNGILSSGILFTQTYYNHFSKTRTGRLSTGGAQCEDTGTETHINFDEHSIIPIASYQGSHIGYSEVNEFYIDKNEDTEDITAYNLKKNGYTRYQFINDYVPITQSYPYHQQEDLSYKNGKLLFETVYKASNGAYQRVKETKYQYRQRQIQGSFGGMVLKRVVSDFCYHCAIPGEQMYKYAFYNYPTIWHYLVKVTETSFDDDYGYPATATITRNYYDTITPYTHYLPVQTKIFYDGDGNPETRTMKYIRDSQNPGLVTEFTTLKNNLKIDGRKITYSGKLPIDIFKWNNSTYEYYHHVSAQVDGNANYVKRTIYPGISNQGQTTGYIWGYDNKYPIAEIVNAVEGSFAFTSFEEDGATAEARTGERAHLGQYTVQLPSPGIYVLSYWRKSGTAPWEYVEMSGVSSNQTIGGSGVALDDVRLFPTGALMTTYTYNRGIGITSVTDPNNRTNYYEYDDFGRLKLIRDHEGNIIKTYEYNYQLR